MGNLELFVFWLTVGLFGLFYAFIIWLSSWIINNNTDKEEGVNNLANEESEEFYPGLKELTPEEIEEIHSRGMITAREKIDEWEAFGLCAPGDAIGSAGWRCKKFSTCRKCLCDYVGDRTEFHKFGDHLEGVNSFNFYI